MSSTKDTGGNFAGRNAHAQPSDGDAGLRIAFVDPRIDDMAGAASSLPAGTELVPLDPARDAVAQIAETLHGQRGVASVHVASGDIDFSAGAFTHGSVTANSESGYSLWSSNPGRDAVETLTRSVPASNSVGYDPTATVHDFSSHAAHHHGIEPGGVSLSVIYDASQVGSGGVYTNNELGFSYGTPGDAKFDDLFTGYSGSGYFGNIFNSSAPSDFLQFGSNAVFTAATADGRELWITDGTEAGTHEVANLNTTHDGLSSTAPMAVVGSELFFAANDGTHGFELWMTDGASNTTMVKDIVAGSGSSLIGQIVSFNGSAYFTASDGQMAGGDPIEELWVSNGTSGGTTKIFTPSAGSGLFTAPAVFDLTVSGNHLFFVSYDGTLNSDGSQVWVTDGTSVGTHQLIPSVDALEVHGLTDVNGTLYFTMNDGTHKDQIWKSDGTTTTMVSAVDTDPSTGDGLGGNYFTAKGGNIFFVGSDSQYNSQLWELDGTGAGAHLVKDIVNTSGPSSAIYTSLTVVGNELYFGAQTTGVGGVQLWESDGTEAGTQLVDTTGIAHNVTDLKNVNGTLYFVGQGNSDSHIDLFKYDGTTITEVVSGFTQGGDYTFLPNGTPVQGEPDAFVTDEATKVMGHNLFADNGSGADTGSPLSIAQVNDSAANVGANITLASGAHLIVHADGTFIYNPSHAFDYLAASGSGATDLQTTDSFTYKLTGAASDTTVTITINGLDSNDTVIGTGNADTLTPGTGEDTVQANGGDDTIAMGANLDANDKIDGGLGNDTVTLSGGGAVVMNATTMVNVEKITLADGHNYSLTTADATVASTQTLTVDGSALGAASSLSFNGAPETNGFFVLKGGAGGDSFTMGAALNATDQIDGGAGNDTVTLNGDYSAGLTFGAATMVNVESLVLTAGHDYSLTMNAATVASGQTLTVGAASFGAGDDLVFNGSADTAGGAFVVNAGAGNDTLTGGIGNDVFRSGGGTDIIHGGGGDDTVNMGAALVATDQIDGGTGNDAVILNGNYSGGVTFGATTMVNVETLSLTAGFDYSLTMNNATVAAGQMLTVKASLLGSSDNLTFNGSADTTGGSFAIYTGAGNDSLTGGSNDDTFNFGATFNAQDHVDGGAGNDTLNLTGDYSAGLTITSAMMTNVETLGLTAGFDYDLIMAANTVGSGQSLTVKATTLGAGDVVTFDGSANTGTGAFVVNSGAGNDVLTGGAGDDTFRPGTGSDTVHGGGGDDTINMGTGFDAGDQIDGGTGNDTLALVGDYSAGVTLGAATLTNIDLISLGAGFDYKLVLNNATIAASQSMTIKATTLGSGDTLYVDASADTTGGSLTVNGGAGNDTLIGGAGTDVLKAGDGTNIIEGGGASDTLSGGAGADQFVYAAVTDSTGQFFDKVIGFDGSMDSLKFIGDTINAIDAAVTTGKLSLATFDANLASAIGAAQLGAHDAVLFTPTTGDQHGATFLIVDANGIAGYQAGQDYVIELAGATNLGSLTTSSFFH